MGSNILNNVDAQGKVQLLVIADELSNPQSKYHKLLNNVQGHILKDNGRDHSVHLFLNFRNASSNSIRSLFEQLASATYTLKNTLGSTNTFHYVPSTMEQLVLRHLVREGKDAAHRNTYFVNVHLTGSGYEAMGFSKQSIPSGLLLPTERAKNMPPGRTNRLLAFLTFLIDKEKLNPNQFNQRDPRFDDIHAMIVIAHNNEIPVTGNRVNIANDSKLQNLIDSFGDYVFSVEKGKVLYDCDDQTVNEPIEHFGYRDGISVPVFFKEDWDKKLEEDIYPRFIHFDPSAPLRLALSEDPNFKDAEHAFGSYMVFGKLEQNVRAFEDDIAQMARHLKGHSLSEKKSRARALVMGRFQDGTPITEQGREGGIRTRLLDGTPPRHSKIAASPNDFDFEKDPWGFHGAGRCPLHAHIRRANPRGQVEKSLPVEMERRIVRRGIPYGARDVEPKDNPSLNDLPTQGVGLLFMCFQRDIENQFEHILDHWCLYDDHRDAVMRDKPLDAGPTTLYDNWPDQWYKDPAHSMIVSVPFDFSQHVSFKGGDYFFTPSVKFLRALSKK